MATRMIVNTTAPSTSIILTALASVGALETAYLTTVKLFNTSLVCPTNGCSSVLTSSYSELWGIPLSLFGMLTYGAVAAVAWTASCRSKENPDTTLDTALTLGTTALASCSAVLIYLLNTEFKGSVCLWCYLSASLSAGLFITSVTSMSGRQLQAAAAPTATVLASSVAALYFGFGSFGQSTAEEEFVLPYKSPTVTEVSSPTAVTLASRLSAAGAKMYGAFWCTHCFEQKQAFGVQAMQDFPYVECYPEGWQRGAKVAAACESANVKAFPTWVIGGRNIEGELLLPELEAELNKASS
ncbi:MAG: hypothetical protein WDW38_000480 [Sanguina aurantia]